MEPQVLENFGKGASWTVYHALQQRKVANVPAVGSLGLFYSGLELLPESFGKPGESVKQALAQRLTPKFKFLLVSTVGTLLDDLAGTRSSSQPKELDPQQMAALSVTFEIIQ